MTAETEQPEELKTIPEADELSEAVSKILATENESHKPTIKEIQKMLTADHPTWKVPERRVKKFVKRVKADKLKVATTTTTPTSPDAAASGDSTLSPTTSKEKKRGSKIISGARKLVAAATSSSPTNAGSSSAADAAAGTISPDAATLSPTSQKTRGSKILSGAKNLIRQVSKRKKGGFSDESESAPPRVESEASNDPTVDESQETPTPAEAEASEGIEVDVSETIKEVETNPYEDDNTGDKKEDCCAQSCVIL